MYKCTTKQRNQSEKLFRSPVGELLLRQATGLSSYRQYDDACPGARRLNSLSGAWKTEAVRVAG